MAKKQISLPEIWGGIECTVNRLRDIYIDQVELTGHSHRIEDLDLFSQLGITKLRYPVIWEKVYDHKSKKYNWDWTDERLNRLKELNIDPIAGLIHHGSGPYFTNLTDPGFPELFRDFAAAVAGRYPWITFYNPINEPLTTARFSCLYGYWYPHLKDDLAFSKAMLNECRGVILAMQAINEINPSAKLIQTEDLANITSTKKLRYQSDFENKRRWLTYDLLCGMVNQKHPMWKFFIDAGIHKTELEFFIKTPRPPDVLGANYYLTSERFLDHHTRKYPRHAIGRNKYQRYADVEAVRVKGSGYSGLYNLLKLMYARYKIPIAITEAHLSCTREEQIRWFYEIYNTSKKLNAENVEVRAVTAWSLLGAFDWHNLVTKIEGVYEPGVFDIRAPKPRQTELGNLISHLASGTEYANPLIQTTGWWNRFERFHFENKEAASIKIHEPVNISEKLNNIKPLIIIKGIETFAQSYEEHCIKRGIPFITLDKRAINVYDVSQIEAVLVKNDPWAVINIEDFNDIDKAEIQPDQCKMDNVVAAVNIGTICAKMGIRYLSFSTDLVFNGNRKEPYIESCEVAPLNVYGVSKAAAEQKILRNNPSALVIRTGACFSSKDHNGYINSILKKVENGRKVTVPKDIIISPTYTPDLINTSLDILIDGEKGIWHLTNRGSESWADFIMKLVETSGYDCKYIDPRSSMDIKFIARRPNYSVLTSEHATLMPTFEQALSEYKILLNLAEPVKEKF